MHRFDVTVDASIDGMLDELIAVYEDLHRHPELSMQETRTAKIAADALAAYGFEVTREVGGTGVVGVLKNGDGPTVMLRADMDALPVVEATGLPYASTVRAKDAEGVEVGVAHACGHDLHVTWLIGAARILAKHRELWSGNGPGACFSLARRSATGAPRMMADGMAARFPKPDVILGQHVMVGRRRYRRLPQRHDPVGR